MPSPKNPPTRDILLAIQGELVTMQTAIANVEAQIVAQQDDIEKLANYARYDAESQHGVDANTTGIWDGTDRY